MTARTRLQLASALGVRSVIRRPSRAGLVAVAGALSVVCFGLLVSAALVRSGEAARFDGMVPPPTTDPVPNVAVSHKYRQRTVRFVRMERSTTSVQTNHGETEVPLGEGEMVVSPSLGAALDADPVLRMWFPYERVGIAPRSMVASAGDLVAFVKFGEEGPERLVDGETPASEVTPLTTYETLGFVVFCMLPGVGLLVVAARLGRGARVARFRALRLLGLTDVAARVALAVEVAVPATLGAGLALGVLWVLLPDVFVLPVTDRWIFREDALPPPALGVAVVALTGLAAGLLGGLTPPTRLGDAAPHPAQGWSRWRVLGRVTTVTAFGVGLVFALWSWWLQLPNDPRRSVAVVLIGIGLPGAVAWAASAAGRWIAPSGAPLPWLLGVRRIVTDSRAATRLAGMTGVVVFAVGVAQPYSQVIAQGLDGWVANARREGHESVVATVDLGESPNLAHRVALFEPPPDGVLEVVNQIGVTPPGANDQMYALVASCDQLAQLFDGVVSGCTGKVQRIAWSSSIPVNSPSKNSYDSYDAYDVRSVVSGTSASIEVEGPPVSVSSDGNNSGVEAGLVVPPDEPSLAVIDAPEIYSTFLRVEASQDTWERIRASVIAANPMARLEVHAEAGVTFDSSDQWILLGMMMTGFVLATSMLLVGVDDRSRWRDRRPLRALGVRRSTVVVSEVISGGVAGVVAVALASGSSALLTAAYLRVNDEHLQSTEPYVAVAAGGVLVCLLMALASGLIQARLEDFRTGAT